MLSDVWKASKTFLILTAAETRAALFWLSGLFLFIAIVGLFFQSGASGILDQLRRYSVQIFLLMALFHLYFVMRVKPLYQISRRTWVVSVAVLGVYLVLLKAMDLGLSFKFGETIGSRKSFESWDQILLSLIAAPILEELFFRDILFRGLCSKFKNLPAAIFLSSLFFMLAHSALYPGAFLLGVVSALLVYFSGSILPSIVFHCLSNLSWFFLPALFPNLYRALLDFHLSHWFYR